MSVTVVLKGYALNQMITKSTLGIWDWQHISLNSHPESEDQSIDVRRNNDSAEKHSTAVIDFSGRALIPLEPENDNQL
jgi:hypothetical protein